jgi:hypothetical protein
VRRRAQKKRIRPLKLHCARHTWATFALHAGESIRWVAEQLGHADPGFTLRVYAHAMRDEETDLSFAEFGSKDVSGRLYPSPADGDADDGVANSLERMARREGFDGSLRSLVESASAEQETGTPGGIRTPDPQVRRTQET